VRQNLFAAAHEPASPAVQKASRQNLFTAHEPSSPAVRKQEPFSPAVKGAPKHVELLESPPKFGERGDYAEQRRPKSAVGKPPAARPTDFAAVPRRPPPQLPRDTKSAAPTDDPPSDDAAPTPTTPAAGRDYGGPAHGAWSHDGGRYGVSASPPNISPPSRVSPSTPYEQRHGAFSGLLSAHTAHHTAHAPAAARHATTPRGVGHTPNAGGRNTPSSSHSSKIAQWRDKYYKSTPLAASFDRAEDADGAWSPAPRVTPGSAGKDSSRAMNWRCDLCYATNAAGTPQCALCQQLPRRAAPLAF